MGDPSTDHKLTSEHLHAQTFLIDQLEASVDLVQKRAIFGELGHICRHNHEEVGHCLGVYAAIFVAGAERNAAE